MLTYETQIRILDGMNLVHNSACWTKAAALEEMFLIPETKSIQIWFAY